MVQGIDSHGHKAARLDAVAIDRDVAHRQPGDPRGGRAQPQRLVQHLHGVPEPGHVLGCQLPITDLGCLGGDAILHVAVVAERPTTRR